MGSYLRWLEEVTLVKGGKGRLMQKELALKRFDPRIEGGLKKIITNFPVKLVFTAADNWERFPKLIGLLFGQIELSTLYSCHACTEY